MNRPKDDQRPSDPKDDTAAAQPKNESDALASPEAAAPRETDKPTANSDPAVEPATAEADEGTGDGRPAPGDDPGVNDEWREDTEPAAEVRGEPEPEPEPEPERPAPARDERDEREVPDEEEEHGMGVAARMLVLLLVSIIGGVGALYAAPKLAPHVPAGVARYLVPGEADAQARIDALGEDLAATRARLDAVEAALSERAAQEAVVGVAEAVTALEARISDLETATATLGNGLAALRDAPPAAAPSVVAGETPEAVADALAALTARLDAVAATAGAAAPAEALAGLRAELDALAGRVAAVETSRDGELAQLEQAVRASALERAIGALAERARTGQPFEAQLSEVEAISGETAPAPLAGAAAGGVPSTLELGRTMPDAARAALAADIRASAEPGLLGQLGAWARSQVIMRPTVAREGEDVASVLSRVGAKLEAGDAGAAEAEVAALPEHARAAMGGWLEMLAARAAADKALADWLGALGARG
ncbi:hypothetical protein M1105_09695 [Limibaculum sp. FT325]|uniref:hypothetical protein n=1 Tax=Thermohalobaculum sediminis TaxID=2939436 RepID=UPI0020BDDCCF|nr:hypothetical protein [Limibaculum sediminis]MCL5777259.1 hypothetical protein [Limibaculum sediminis]